MEWRQRSLGLSRSQRTDGTTLSFPVESGKKGERNKQGKITCKISKKTCMEALFPQLEVGNA